MKRISINVKDIIVINFSGYAQSRDLSPKVYTDLKPETICDNIGSHFMDMNCQIILVKSIATYNLAGLTTLLSWMNFAIQ